MNDNVGGFDKIISRVTLIRKWAEKGINFALVAYPLIENWYMPILYRGGFVGTVKIKLRDNKKPPMLFRFWLVVADILSKGFASKERIDKNHLYFNYKGKQLVFFYKGEKQLLNTIEQVKDHFLDCEYGKMDVKGKTVVDIGGSIGDTAIYFVLANARKVYAFEPYPYAFNVALKNLKLNGADKKTVFLNECLGSESGTMLIDEKFESDERSRAVRFKKGKAIKIVTLENIVKEYGLRNAELKMDCEGFEYEILLGAKNSVLRKFDHMMIEYHYGYKDIERKLQDAGFEVQHDLPIYTSKNPFGEEKDVYYGLMYAQRRTK